jgi:hypothetical protein
VTEQTFSKNFPRERRKGALKGAFCNTQLHCKKQAIHFPLKIDRKAKTPTRPFFEAAFFISPGVDLMKPFQEKFEALT